MKVVVVLSLLVPSFFVSCESTNSRRQGGGAFDPSWVGPILDGNREIPNPEDPTNQSLEDFREINE